MQHQATTSKRRLITAEELWRLPPIEGRRELIFGKVQEMTPVGRRHGRVTLKIGRKLAEYVEEHDLGEVNAGDTGFYLQRDPDLVRAADVAFVAQSRIPDDMPDEKYWPIAPDLAVEVVSPGDRTRDILDKVQDYIEAGTRLVWFVNPERRTVTVYDAPDKFHILHEDDWLDGKDVLPGFRCQVQEIM